MTGFDTDWPADSAEFCPHANALDFFVVGTYKLEQPTPTDAQPVTEDEDGAHGSGTPPPEEKKPQKRRGKCLLFRVDEDDHFNKLHETKLPAILDMKWCHRTPAATPLLGIADSEGHITLHELDTDESRLRQIQSISCASSDILCLSLDWSNRRQPTERHSGLGNLIVSLSDGSLSLLKPEERSGLAITDSWHAHDYEPWIAAWNYWDTNVVYSGGDDLKMKGWDIRQGGAAPIFVNKRFDAGVTTIQSHPYVEHILAVGSYDNTVRIFDTRKPLVPLVQADVGGGAWRVKWHPSAERKNDLLVACMHDGFKVVRFDLGTGEDPSMTVSSSDRPWEVVKRFDEHTSLAYGVDWSFAGDKDDGGTLVASCSFYDHTLHTWRA
ncbi:WD-40 repeat-containing protein [Trametes cingulata]|nr:WD-40 repeat-containing protein [Trametes cingulata]